MKGILLFGFLVVISACTQERTQLSESDTELAIQQEQSAEERDINQVEKLPAQSNGRIVNEERKIAYQAHVDIIVNDFQAAEKKIKQAVTNIEGYIVSSDVHRSENELSGTITVKVPQEKFEPFLTEIKELSYEVMNENIHGDDVTEEYVDLTARLKAKQDVRKKLETFLEDANTTKDLLAVSEQLGNVQEEIEQLEGRLNVLKNQTDFSSVTLSMTEQNLKIGELGSKEQNTWTRAKQLLVSTVNGLIAAASNVVVVLIGLSPIIVPLGIIVFGVWLYRKRRKKDQ